MSMSPLMRNTEPNNVVGFKSMKLVHVAVAVIMRGNDVLIARRPDHVHQGGLWEFPGGKVEPNETVQHALKRELKEELDIEVSPSSGIEPLIRIRHDYSDKSVLLDVWIVTSFDGEPTGAEGQPIQWVTSANLNDFSFPEANKPIISAILLPRKYLIIGAYETPEDCLTRLKRAIDTSDIKLVQFRNHTLLESDRSGFIVLAGQIANICQEYGVRLILNAAPSILDQVNVDGVHLTATEAKYHTTRPISRDRLLGVSCHSAEELHQARLLEPDYVLLSPIKETATHPGAEPLGWTLFRALSDQTAFPVFALGGMEEQDFHEAIGHGAQGIAAIRAWWQ